MGLVSESVRFGGDAYVGYLSYPARAKAPMPAIVALQEAWGVDDHIEDVTRRFAAAGYVALAPDVYATDQGKRPEALARPRLKELVGFVNAHPTAWGTPAQLDEALAGYDEAARARLRGSFEAVKAKVGGLAALIDPVLAATRYLRTEQPLTRGQRVGAIGFCMGGGLAGLLACSDPELAAAVICFGSAPPLDRVPAIQCPVLGQYGETDARVNAQIAPFEEAMRKAGKRFEHHIYAGAGHAFFNDERPSYDAAASRATFARALELFRAQLG